MTITAPESTSATRPLNGVDVEHNPFDGPERQAKTERERVERARVQRWAVERFNVEDVAALSASWARTVAADVRRFNAARNPTKTPPTLVVSGDKLVSEGATDADLGKLHPLTEDERWSLSVQAAAALADVRNQVTERARALAAERAAADVEIVGRVNLAEHVPNLVQWTVGEMLSRTGVLGLFGERKAGKTHTVEALVRAAVDGLPFLGRYPVTLPESGDVVLFDTEMPTDDLWRNYRAAGVENLARLDLRPLRGQERALDVRSETIRAGYAATIAPGSLLVLDCLYTLFGALGISESSDEVVEVLAGLRALATECDAVGLVLVHHLGKDTTKGARGHSSIEGFPDAIARIELAGPLAADTPRVFSAYGRGVDIPAAVLEHDADGRLTIGVDPTTDRRSGRAAARDRADDDRVSALVRDYAGLSGRGLFDIAPEIRGEISRNRINAALLRLKARNEIVNTGTDAAPEWHPAAANGDPFDVPKAATDDV